MNTPMYDRINLLFIRKKQNFVSQESGKISILGFEQQETYMIVVQNREC